MRIKAAITAMAMTTALLALSGVSAHATSAPPPSSVPPTDLTLTTSMSGTTRTITHTNTYSNYTVTWKLKFGTIKPHLEYLSSESVTFKNTGTATATLNVSSFKIQDNIFNPYGDPWRTRYTSGAFSVKIAPGATYTRGYSIATTMSWAFTSEITAGWNGPACITVSGATACGGDVILVKPAT